MDVDIFVSKKRDKVNEDEVATKPAAGVNMEESPPMSSGGSSGDSLH